MVTTKMRAISLRKKGKSYGEISTLLKVPKSTLSSWLKTIPLAQRYRNKLYTKAIQNLNSGTDSIRERRNREVQIIVDGAKSEIPVPLSRETWRLFGSALYWAEGSKTGGLQFTNSDPSLVFFMVQWFSEMFSVSPKTFKVWLNIYPQQNEKELKQFWSQLCGIPLSRFGKSFIKPLSKGYKKNNLYYGTARIYVPKSTNFKHCIYGWIQAALETDKVELESVKRKWGKLQSVEKPTNLH